MTIAENLERIRRSIRNAAQEAHRNPADVLLIAVSKIQSPDAIRDAYEAGHRDFGESYVQELQTKQAELGDLPDVRWHFIGHLQRNKARHVAGRVATVQTVDSSKLVRELAARARPQGLEVPVLLQVNLAGEDTKSGCSRDDTAALLDEVQQTDGVTPRGLMTLPPFASDPEDARSSFAMLRQLRDELGGPAVLPELSMGMTHDFHVAIEEGATMVRVGTAIFGPRNR